MPGGFKDLSELHNASVESGQPEMFHKVLEAAMWKAEREHARLVRSALRDSNLTNRSLEQFGAFRIADLSEPEPRKYLIRNMASPGLPTYVYGAAATCKSLAGASSAIAIAHEDIPYFCGFPVEQHGPVVVFDSELDVIEINRRIRQLCAGMKVDIPRELYYVSAVGFPPEESFPNLLKLCEFVGAISTLIDSVGFAMHGDPESYHHTSQNLRDYIDPLRSLGVAPIIIDHKPHQGDNLFGSVSKTYHGRYIFQVKDLDGESRDKGKRKGRGC
jgi:AAA domain